MAKVSKSFLILTIPKFGVLVSLQDRVTVEPWWASNAVLFGVRNVTSSSPNILESISVSSDLALLDEAEMLLPTATTEMHHPEPCPCHQIFIIISLKGFFIEDININTALYKFYFWPKLQVAELGN